ncbi:hypothetical protein D2E52_07430 [Mycobacteroides abscessus]|uniref:Uncharacterized protein n=1 Tax=Mycobacteroides abscessus 21 TaxID=1299324 RepID=A0A829PYS0_9MYCO|nr:hypothetical protein I543_0027 [Mycobacteroides abscessus 21]PVA31473.1 hypothetical protein DDJ98_18630 [Mycobacteroides abscessus]PVB13086.1 hypothetical protein DDJ68_19600 [Mycobacteroides abscessus]RIR84983.1 hypothetical protein D2E57_23040 [Mycobacteroides abscessus]RIR91931.1 hypothetical protein D2E50_10530 [Mycobacteroides abscessus]
MKHRCSTSEYGVRAADNGPMNYPMNEPGDNSAQVAINASSGHAEVIPTATDMPSYGQRSTVPRLRFLQRS